MDTGAERQNGQSRLPLSYAGGYIPGWPPPVPVPVCQGISNPSCAVRYARERRACVGYARERKYVRERKMPLDNLKE